MLSGGAPTLAGKSLLLCVNWGHGSGAVMGGAFETEWVGQLQLSGLPLFWGDMLMV